MNILKNINIMGRKTKKDKLKEEEVVEKIEKVVLEEVAPVVEEEIVEEVVEEEVEEIVEEVVEEEVVEEAPVEEDAPVDVSKLNKFQLRHFQRTGMVPD